MQADVGERERPETANLWQISGDFATVNEL
jgi:hypothetical protein